MILGLGLGNTRNTSVLGSINTGILDFIKRVEQGGGVIENPDYVAQELSRFAVYEPILLNIPAAYAESKAFSIVPFDGSGDLSWVRNSTKTRVNGQGNIEEVPTNLFQSSNDISSVWGKIRVTTPDANTIQDDTDTGVHTPIQAGAQFNSIGVVSMQVEMEADTFNFVRLYENGGTNGRVMCNLTTGEVSGVGGGNKGQGSVKLDNGRYVFWFSCDTNTLAANGNFQIRLSPDGITDNYTGDGNGRVKVYRMGLFKGNGYQENWGVVTTNRLNVPALDSSTGVQRWSVEPQRTNLFTYSQNLNGGTWAIAGGSAPQNNLYVANGAVGSHRVAQSQNVTSGLNYTASCEIDPSQSTTQFVQIAVSGGGISANSWVNFDINNNLLGAFNGNVSNATLTKLSSGNILISAVFPASATSSVRTDYCIVTSLTASFIENSTTTDSMFIDNRQLEAGSYHTSSIHTQASAVTRSEDVSSTLNLGSLFNNTEGSWLIEASAFDSTEIPVISISDGTTQNEVEFAYFGNNQYNMIVRAGGVSSSIAGTVDDATKVNSFFGTWKNNVFKLFVNGVKIGENTNNNVPQNMDRLRFSLPTGANKYKGYVGTNMILDYYVESDEQGIQITS
jgi:hypothetical protein